MGPNELLFWMTERRIGSWQQFRAAVRNLGLGGDQVSGFPIHQEFRQNLSRHAHVEFGNEEGEESWRVAPAVLAGTKIQGRFVGVLCGARSPALLDDLRSAAQVEVVEAPNCPNVVRVSAVDEPTLASLARAVGIPYQSDSAASLCRFLNPISTASIGPPAEMPFGRDVTAELFVADSRRPRWQKLSQQEARRQRDGLFRCIRWQMPTHFWKKNGQVFATSGQTGKFVALYQLRRRVVRYFAGTHELKVPAICRPPELVERALLLCSGLPAREEFSAGRQGDRSLILAYQNIDPAVAGLVSELLRQPLS
jgi:hypothetical protein